jgi:hypothetical protein
MPNNGNYFQKNEILGVSFSCLNSLYSWVPAISGRGFRIIIL